MKSSPNPPDESWSLSAPNTTHIQELQWSLIKCCPISRLRFSKLHSFWRELAMYQHLYPIYQENICTENFHLFYSSDQASNFSAISSTNLWDFHLVELLHCRNIYWFFFLISSSLSFDFPPTVVICVL